jgi:hypothetical protein
MAADTRPYKSKEQDGQGNEVIIRDQQLVEQSTVTTMPSGACFETLDIDGRPVKIPRDNMMSIVLECIGIVLNDSSKNLGTNVNKALGLQGNTIGNVTVNDFASVLGVTYYLGVVSDEPDSDGLMVSYYANSISGYPSTYMKCIKFAHNAIFGMGFEGDFYIYWGDQFGWRKIPTTTP